MRNRVEIIVHDYLEAWKSPYSDLGDLDQTEREELFGVLMDELGVVMHKRDFDQLVDKEDLEVEDLVEALGEGTAPDGGVEF